MNTTHKTIIGDSRNLCEINDESIDLVVTSPPYPMIQMWDESFSSISSKVNDALVRKDGQSAFEAMHHELDKTWKELYRVLKTGSFACINIGDATRTINGRFRLYPNHARIISAFLDIGFDALPVILWRKTTNAPNKFLGSGMLPSGAYVTLEHEYILIFRKGPKRDFSDPLQKNKRMESSFFWEERNKWFSDIWDFKGVIQNLNNRELRNRSAAFPIEMAYRLVNMYSLYSDTILDPFAGTGTTSLAAIASGRSSIGIEIDRGFAPVILEQQNKFLEQANALLHSRISSHIDFVASRSLAKGPLKYLNEPHGFAVMTRQETQIRLYRIAEIIAGGEYETKVKYELAGNLL